MFVSRERSDHMKMAFKNRYLTDTHTTLLKLLTLRTIPNNGKIFLFIDFNGCHYCCCLVKFPQKK